MRARIIRITKDFLIHQMKQPTGTFIKIVESGLPRDSRVISISDSLRDGIIDVLVESQEFDNISEGGIFPFHNNPGIYTIYSNKKAILKDKK